MPRLSIETRKRVVILRKKGYSVDNIRTRLAEEQIFVSKMALYALIKKYKKHGSIQNLPKPKPPHILNFDQVKFIDDSLAQNDEMTAWQLQTAILKKWPNVKVSISTVKRMRQSLGWVATRPKYCQLVRQVNMDKRLSWCKDMLKTKETFDNVLFTDECSVQLDNHGRLCFRKKNQARKLKPRPKHPVKVHIWGGISKQGATSIVLFTGTMTSIRYCTILEKALKPFITRVFPDNGYRFQQDNDPKHVSHFTKEYLVMNGINWWPTPPESSDLNPIENVWGSLKYFLRHQHKPTNLETLKTGILQFWRSLTPEVCTKYISHLNKVMPKVIEVNGAASGY